MLPTEDLFVYVYVLIHDLIGAGAVAIPAPRAPNRPAATPSCSPSRWCATCWAGERGRIPGRGGPRLGAPVPAAAAPKRGEPADPLAVGRIRAVPGDAGGPAARRRLPAGRHLRAAGQHTSRVRGPDQWTGPGNDLAARFGRDAAHAEWFYGFRLAIKTDLGSRIVRAWSIVPAAVNEREVAEDLLQAGPPPRDLLCDKGFNGKAFAAGQAARGTAVLVPPAKNQRASMPAILQKVIAQWRNRIEASFGEITDLMGLARHGAHTFWGLLTRTAATIAAHTLLRTCLAVA